MTVVSPKSMSLTSSLDPVPGKTRIPVGRYMPVIEAHLAFSCLCKYLSGFTLALDLTRATRVLNGDGCKMVITPKPSRE